MNSNLQGDVTMVTVPFLMATSGGVAGELAADLDGGAENGISVLITAAAESKEAHRGFLEPWRGSLEP